MTQQFWHLLFVFFSFLETNKIKCKSILGIKLIILFPSTTFVRKRAQTKTELRGLSPEANYTDLTTRLGWIYITFHELSFLCGLFDHDANISYYRVLNSRMVNSEFERIGKEIVVV
jgi:hypothetical protein